MAMGIYPFRCIECNHRFPVNVWLFSKLAFAKCPKCLGGELGGWPQKHYRLPFWKNLLITFGAHRYRCSNCRCRFISFRPRQHGVVEAVEMEPLPPDEHSEAERMAETESKP